MNLGGGTAWLDEAIAPRAQALDTDSTALATALADAGAQGLLGVRVPAHLGGAAWSPRDFLAWQQACARASGIFAFLQAQHQSACAVAAQSQNPAIHADWLPRMAAGEVTTGIAFSHLRRPGHALVATRVDNGWVLEGQAPWVTGQGLFTHCATAAAVPDEDATLFVLHPLLPGPGLVIGPVLDLAAFTAARTVTLGFHQHFVPDDRVLAVTPRDWIGTKDRLSVAAQGMFAIGCALAALDLTRETGLAQEVAEVQRTLIGQAQQGDRYSEALAARGQAIALMGRCAHAAVATSGGSANLSRHAAQRVWRECLVFTVLSQSPDVRAATLAALTRPKPLEGPR